MPIDFATRYERLRAERERVVQFLDTIPEEPNSGECSPGSPDFDRVRDRAGLARGILDGRAQTRPRQAMIGNRATRPLSSTTLSPPERSLRCRLSR